MVTTDLPAARALWTRCLAVELAEGDDVATLTRYLERNPGFSQVACLDGQLVGAVLAGHDGRRGVMYHLAVEENYRGCGVGTELVRRALKALRSAGLERVLVLVSRENVEGAAFWRNQGWEPVAHAEAWGLNLM